jgi:hypothetical protein
MSRVSAYNVWVHIEGVDAEGDCLEGDEFHEPHKLACFRRLSLAEDFRDLVKGAADSLMIEDKLK